MTKPNQGIPGPVRRLAAGALAATLLLGAAGPAAAVRARWTETVNGSANSWDYGQGIAADRRSVYLVGSLQTAGTDSDLLIRRYGSRHAERWTDLVDGGQSDYDSARGVAITPDGGAVVVGMATPAGTGFVDAWVRRYEADGSARWTDTVGAPGTDELARGAAVGPDGTIVVVGQTSENGGDIWVRAYRPGGGVKWTRTADGSAHAYDDAYGVAVGRDGSVFVCGFVTTAASAGDGWVRKYSPKGRTRWTRTFDGEAMDDYAGGIAVRPDGSVVVVGAVQSFATGEDILVRAYSAGGARLWTRTVDGGAGNDDTARGVGIGGDGTVFVAGTVEDAVRNADIWVRGYSPRGRALWTKTYDGPSHDYDSVRGLAVAPDGSVYVTGTTFVGGQDQDVFIRRYR